MLRSLRLISWIFSNKFEDILNIAGYWFEKNTRWNIFLPVSQCKKKCKAGECCRIFWYWYECFPQRGLGQPCRRKPPAVSVHDTSFPAKREEIPCTASTKWNIHWVHLKTLGFERCLLISYVMVQTCAETVPSDWRLSEYSFYSSLIWLINIGLLAFRGWNNQSL